MELDLSRFCSKEALQAEMETMNGFGTRLTGAKGQTDFVRYLRKRIEDMGLMTYSDLYAFDRWEAKRTALTIHHDDSDEAIEVTSPWPYSGETGPLGITEEIVAVSDKRLGYLPARGKIALVTVSDLGSIPSNIAFNQRRAYPEDVSIPAFYKGPVATSFGRA